MLAQDRWACRPIGKGGGDGAGGPVAAAVISAGAIAVVGCTATACTLNSYQRLQLRNLQRQDPNLLLIGAPAVTSSSSPSSPAALPPPTRWPHHSHHQRSRHPLEIFISWKLNADDHPIILHLVLQTFQSFLLQKKLQPRSCFFDHAPLILTATLEEIWFPPPKNHL